MERYKPVQQIIKKQKDTGLWGSNLLGTEANKVWGIKEPGTITRYRQLLEMGLSADARPFRLANRTLYRVLSRDPNPELLFEYRKESKRNVALREWAKDLLREGVVAALVQGNQQTDPRVRGAATKMANRVATFLRSDYSTQPLVKSGRKYTLHPQAHPPTLFTFTMAAHMPEFKRERASLVDRMLAFVNEPAPDVSYSIQVGDTAVEPTYQLLGDPLALDAGGRPKDIPFALHWIELLARIGGLHVSASAQRALGSLLEDCDEDGVWNPKGLRGIPKSSSTLADFAFPLETDSKIPEHRKADVTFRLALIAKLCGWTIEYS